MGRARVLSSLGDGLFLIERPRDMVRRVELEERLQERLAELLAIIAEIEAAIALLEAERQVFLDEYDSAFALYMEAVNDPEVEQEVVSGYRKAMNAAMRSALPLSGQIAEKTRSRDLNALELASVQMRLDDIGDAESRYNAPFQAWCMDLTESIGPGTIVATAEIPGEPSRVLIYPRARKQGQYQPGRDGELVPREWQDPNQVFYNAAILPGWQKFKPTYRVGTISALSGNTCSVALDAVDSTAQGLDVNQSQTLSGLPIEYMNCNGFAFAIGDRVVVEFQNRRWDGDKRVIGFVSNPKACVLPPTIYLFVYPDLMQAEPGSKGFFETLLGGDMVTPVPTGKDGQPLCDPYPFFGLPLGDEFPPFPTCSDYFQTATPISITQNVNQMTIRVGGKSGPWNGNRRLWMLDSAFATEEQEEEWEFDYKEESIIVDEFFSGPFVRDADGRATGALRVNFPASTPPNTSPLLNNGMSPCSANGAVTSTPHNVSVHVNFSISAPLLRYENTPTTFMKGFTYAKNSFCYNDYGTDCTFSGGGSCEAYDCGGMLSNFASGTFYANPPSPYTRVLESRVDYFKTPDDPVPQYATMSDYVESKSNLPNQITVRNTITNINYRYRYKGVQLMGVSIGGRTSLSSSSLASGNITRWAVVYEPILS